MKYLLILGAALLWASVTSAAPITACSASDFMAGGENAAECAIGDTANDSETDVNAQGVGGFDDWSLLAKSDDDDPALVVTEKVGAAGFNWSFLGTLADGTDALFVVKQGDPNGNNPGGWVGYTFTPLETLEGMFFTELSFAVNDFSHVSLYTREGDTPMVPEPTAALLIGLGLAAVASRRKA